MWDCNNTSNFELFTMILINCCVGSKMQLPIYMIYINHVRKKPRSFSSYLVELRSFLKVIKVEIKELKDWNKWKELNMDYIYAISWTLLFAKKVLNILISKN